MTDSLIFGLVLAHIWGAAIAVFMRTSDFGRWMAHNMMWFIVSCGAGIDLLIVRWLLTDAGAVLWWDVVLIFFASSLWIAGWSVYDLSKRFMGAVRGHLRE